MSSPMPAPPGPTDPVLFVSCVPGKPVSRLPLPGSGSQPSIIGATRKGREYVYDATAIVGLTRAEIQAHGRIYERAIREKNLVRRTREDFESWRSERRAAAEAHKEAAIAAAKEK